MQSLRIVTRTSPLALWQAKHIQQRIKNQFPELDIEIIGLKTTGDKWLSTSLQKIGGKGLFVKELQEALLSGKADLAVHSLKDIPAQFPEGLHLAAICERENPFDAWISKEGSALNELPTGSKVGTSSLRRQVQLARIRPDLHYEPLRGNVDTRIKQCFDGKWDAIVLAVAGLKRLDLENTITSIFTPEEMLPAVGQGALALECRTNDEKTNAILSFLNHIPTRVCIEAERAMNAKLGGNCQVPVAGFAEIKNNRISLIGKVGDLKGTMLFAKRDGVLNDPRLLGEQVAQDLIVQGADVLIQSVLSNE